MQKSVPEQREWLQKMRSKSQVALCTQALRRATENCTKADSRPMIT